MRKFLTAITALSFLATAAAQTPKLGSVKVSPNGVNVNANGASVVFLTFGGLNNQRVGEGCWCGELISAAPDLGFKCNPATVFGCLPERYDRSTVSGNRAFTDIMSIPASVSRRAYEAAQDGAVSSFFYVRRFVNTKGGPDEYVPVTCRMASGGVSVPFSLTDVRLAFGEDKPIVFIKPGEKLPPLKAEIAYNGTGRLKGRWEVVLPGDELPSSQDLLTEGSLPVEERGLQRRFTELGRFNEFLPPIGRYMLAGPDISRLPSTVEGSYLVLLRVEVIDDKDGGANLGAVGAGKGFVNSGAVAGFPLPVLRYFVGSGSAARPVRQSLSLLLPADNVSVSSHISPEFSWSENEQGAFYGLEVQDRQGKQVLAAILPAGIGIYRAPSWLKDRAGDGTLRWRVVGLDQTGNRISETPWRNLRLTPAN